MHTSCTLEHSNIVAYFTNDFHKITLLCTHPNPLIIAEIILITQDWFLKDFGICLVFFYI